MAARHLGELITWQLAEALRTEVNRLVRESPGASRQFRFRAQLLDAAADAVADIAEGFGRRSPGDFVRFLDYSIASLAEVESRVTDGIARGYFPADAGASALLLKRRCNTAARRLRESQVQEAERRRRAKRRRTK